MKKNYLLIALILLVFSAANTFAQFSNSRFFIRFTDKNNSPYSISNPSAYLSARAIQRRTNQSIVINQQDLPVNPQYIDSLIAHGATTYNASKWLNGVTVSVASQAVLNNILALPFVISSTHVKQPLTGNGGSKFEMDLRTNEGIPNEVQSYNYGLSFNQIHLMNGEYLHDQGYRGEGMQIALLDAGYNDVSTQKAFDSLRARGAILATWDFVNNELDVYTTNNDNGHGASVLSCIAGNVPDSLVGTAPMADFYLLRSEDAPVENIIEEYDWATAAEYADSAGADIISSSLGYTEFDDSTMNHTYADMNGNTCPSSIAADVAASKGILVLVSAGNQGSSAWHYIGAPSDADSALSVGAVNSNGNHSSFSSWGPSSDGDVKPNVCAKGEGTIVSSGGVIWPGNGTSFACPVLAGSAACLWQAHPTMSNMQVFDAIQRSANYFSNPNDTLGYGIPNFIVAHQLLSALEENNLNEELFSVYPNPFKDGLQILLNGMRSKQINVEVYDALGKQVSFVQRAINYNTLNLIPVPEVDNLSKGIYFIKVSGDKVYTKRIVKI
jgi:serine protease AprX